MVKPTQKSQLAFYPIKKCTISAGFKDKTYTQQYGFFHYGVDYCSIDGSDFEVVASCDGEVIGKETRKDNSLGCILVIRYNNVFIPSNGKIMDLIFRYYHMGSVNVNKGDKVAYGTKIGNVLGSHKWWNHLHLEIDIDTKHPYYTPQVAEKSSQLLIRAGANDSTILNPVDVLVESKNQTITIHPYATCANAKDAPKFKESDFFVEELENSGQRLILPINKFKLTASKDNLSYNNRFGFTHYGIDCVSAVGDSTVWASGNGVVLSVGLDSVFGNVVIVEYDNVINNKTNKIENIIFRYFHADKIYVKKGDKVSKDTKLLLYGNTGKYSSGKHLHITADRDCKYFDYEPGLKASGTVIKKGTDTTVFNPLDVLCCKVSPPDNQTYTTANDIYINVKDKKMAEVS